MPAAVPTRAPPRTRRRRSLPRRRVLLRQLVADALPHFQTVLLAARRRVARRDHGERRRDLLVRRGARRARSEVGIDVLAAPRLAVVVERQFFFGVMAVHGWPS